MKKFIPKKGLKVIDPATGKRVPDAGVFISKVTDYWMRREKDKDGEIVEIDTKKIKKTEPSTNDEKGK